MQNDKLLPCPFCGGELKLNTILTVFICDKCKVHIGFPTCYTDENRIKAVNTRKQMERIVTSLENELKLSEEEKKRCVIENPMQFDNAKGYSTGISNALDIVRKGGVEDAE